MNETVISMLVRRLAPALLAFAAGMAAAAAQAPLPPAYPSVTPHPQAPAQAQRNPVCVRLEGQLAGLDRGATDPARADQIRRYEEAAQRQQSELDRLSAQARKMGCEGRGFFSLFGGQPPQCGRINNQIQQMRANLDRMLADVQRLRGGTADREAERRTLLTTLAQNDCGPQYRAYANRGGGFFDSLFGGFGGGSSSIPGMAPGGGDTYRTVCVRTCDGFYFPVSYSTVPSKFAEDEQICRRMCPAAEVVLFSHRNPGEDVSQAVSQGGRLYSELPNAFAYRKAFNPACGCKAAGQTWADALKHLEDTSIERGDIVVTEEQARRLSQPVDSKGRPIPAKVAPKAPPKADEKAKEKAATPPQENGKRTVRTVGPTFLPAR
ncbi:MAG: DUF2865 domain-containing protein [Xanthobacteraceae bacterium]